MSKPVDWTLGIPASTLIAVGTQVSGRFPLDGASAQNLLYRMDGKNITSYINTVHLRQITQAPPEPRGGTRSS
jgi:hypothetical protein